MSACGSSRGGYVVRAHERYMKEAHEKFTLNIEIKIPERYFVRCFGKLIQITEREALMLGKTNVVIR